MTLFSEASLNPPTAMSATPASLLYGACARGELQTVRDMIASLQPTKEHLGRLLIPAAGSGHIDVLRCLLEQGAVIGSSGAPLRAVMRKSTAMLQLFLDFGWDLNYTSSGRSPVLVHAVEDQSMTRWLLDRGADPNLGPPESRGVDSSPITTSGAALNNCAALGTVAVFDLLLEYGAKIENSQPLHAAAESPNEDAERIPMMIHLLDDVRLDVNGLEVSYSFGDIKNTPLHRTLAPPGLKRARLLLEHGADPTKPNSSGSSPIGIAKSLGQRQFVALCHKFT